MKAAVQHRRRVDIQEVETPVPGPHEVLVRMRATTITAADYRIQAILPYVGWLIRLIKRKPIILGMEVAGTVVSVGQDVTRFRIGDEVFGATGLGLNAHAEYTCPLEDRLELKPANMPLAESAAVAFGGLTSLRFLRMAKIAAGQNVLIYGASSSVGVFAVQLAKYFGARVTAVCSGANVEMVRSLGADSVVDYTREDFSEAGPVYDMVFDAVGKTGYWPALRCLKRGRPLVVVALSGGMLSILRDVPRQWWIGLTGAAKIVGGVTSPQPGDLGFLKQRIEAGDIRTVIDRRYPLADIAEALRYAGAGHKKGHVLVEFDSPSAG